MSTRRSGERAASRGHSGLLDDVGKRIVELLQSDGRRSYASVGTEVGLSEAAVRQRVQKLIEAGVMEIVAVTDPLQLGFHRQAMVGLRVVGDLSGAAEALTAMDEVTYVVCEDDDELLDLLSRRIRALPGVQHTETFVYLKLNKQHYNWGTR